MASAQQIPNVNKASGIPRASRLPVLSNKQSQASLQDVGEQLKLSTASAKVPKRPVIPSSSQPVLPASKSTSAIGKRSSTKTNFSNGSNHASRSSTSTASSQTSVAKQSSLANQVPLSPPTANVVRSVEDQENRDGFTSLDSFRAASPQGSHDEFSTEPRELAESSSLPKSPTKTNSSKLSRPSLSDRTIESIQNLPSTPKERRRSTFFSPVDSPMGPPPRPSSSLSRNGSNGGSRPRTSDGSFSFGRPSPVVRRLPASAKSVTKSSIGGLDSMTSLPHRRTASSAVPSRIQGIDITTARSSKSSIPFNTVVPISKSNGQHTPRATPASKTATLKSTKSRATHSDVYGPTGSKVTTKDIPAEKEQSRSQVPGLNDSADERVSSSKSSSAALRQQIAAAKAAARKEKAKNDSPQSVPIADSGTFDMDLHNDPFGQAPKDNKHILRNRINSARMDGRLNIAALELKSIPIEVMQMYDPTAIGESNVSWAEVVDLTRLIAADNEIEELDGTVFPDKSAEDYDLDDQTEGNQFGGLEVLDLHGNRLQAVPIGLRRLERLTSLNLAHNKLENSALDVLCQITSLKDLRLGYNALSGTLPSSISNLRLLETLDLQSNRLLGLPEALRELVGLRVLNVSSNQLTNVPMEALQELPLVELDASNNALIASLFPVAGTAGHFALQSLKVANNSLAALTFDGLLELPRLQALDLSNNHLTSLPPLDSCPELITLAAGDNKIADFPAGFTSLQKLRNANFSSNELRLLDNQIANMESLESLILASNPLREKKFLTMSATDIKRDLKARLTPIDDEETIQDGDTGSNFGHVASLTMSSPSSSWVLKANGTLDLAGRGYSDSINDSLGSFLRKIEVNRLHLQANMLTSLPPALWLGQDLSILDLSGNPLSSDYLSDELELPALQQLDLSRCSLHALEPLITQLRAPNLQTLDVTANRLSGALPILRSSYSSLTTLLAGDNRFTSITADSLHGFHTVNLASNNIAQLPAEVGLLWNEGLRNLEIGSNPFRVPNHRVLEKGTEATMRWLRDRIPASQATALVNGSWDLAPLEH